MYLVPVLASTIRTVRLPIVGHLTRNVNWTESNYFAIILIDLTNNIVDLW